MADIEKADHGNNCHCDDCCPCCCGGLGVFLFMVMGGFGALCFASYWILTYFFNVTFPSFL